MSRKIELIASIIVLAALILACGGTPVPPTATQSPDVVETIVQATLQALLQPPGGTTVTTTSSTSTVLPRSLYFLNDDAGGTAQVFRLDRDGVTLTQITHEVSDIDSYTVASDGRLAYITSNQLLYENADGSGRRILVDGGMVDPNEIFLNRVSSPVWSPDGRTIAFGYQGLNFYSIAGGTYSNVLANVIDHMGGGNIPRELFMPGEYSPDGTSLLVNIGWYEGGTYGIYRIATGLLVKPSMQGILCCSISWAPDSGSLYFASSTMGMIHSGLWRFDTNGTVTTLLPGDAADGTFNYADYPLLAPDGRMYFFFTNRPDIPSGYTPLMLVSSAPDAVTNRGLVLPDTFSTLNNALWAPDASLVVVANATSDDVWEGGRLTAIYTDGRPSRLLADFGSDLKWGP